LRLSGRGKRCSGSLRGSNPVERSRPAGAPPSLRP
jgi:hypothetical protein